MEDPPVLDDNKAPICSILDEYRRWTKGERVLHSRFQTSVEGDLHIESVSGDSPDFRKLLGDVWRLAEADGYFVIGSTTPQVKFTICARKSKTDAVTTLSARFLRHIEEGEEKDAALEALKSWRYYIVFVFTCFASVAAIVFLSTNQYRLLAIQFEPITMAVFLASCITTGFYFVRKTGITSMQIIEYSSVKAMATVVWSLSLLVGATLRKSLGDI